MSWGEILGCEEAQEEVQEGPGLQGKERKGITQHNGGLSLRASRVSEKFPRLGSKGTGIS